MKSAITSVVIRNIAKRALFFSTTNYTNYTNYSWPVAFLIFIEFHKLCEALRRLRMLSNATANIRLPSQVFSFETSRSGFALNS